MRLREAMEQRLILFCIHLIHSKGTSKTYYLYLISCTVPLWTGHRSQLYCIRKDSGLLWRQNGQVGKKTEVQICPRCIILYLLAILLSFSQRHISVGGMMRYPLWYLFVSHCEGFKIGLGHQSVCLPKPEAMWPGTQTSVMEERWIHCNSILYYRQKSAEQPTYNSFSLQLQAFQKGKK